MTSAYQYPEERAELIAELERLRKSNDALHQECDETAARLNRIEAHLRRLADFAEGYIADPWPDSPLEAPKKKRKAK